MVTLSADIVKKTSVSAIANLIPNLTNSSIISNISTNLISELTTAATNALFISSIVDNIAPLSACNASIVSTPTTINSAGIYCLANTITGQIVINSNDVVLDLMATNTK